MLTLKKMGTVVVLVTAVLMNTSVLAKERATGRGHSDAPIVFVASQGLYYDSIVVVESLPMRGNFQQLIPGEMGLTTEFGPGEPGHLGGRWWIDLNANERMDKDDKFFLCPLLGPGREEM